jgi:DNA-directed RNA polymerase subunit L
MKEAFDKVLDYIIEIDAQTISVPSAEQKATQILMDMVRDVNVSLADETSYSLVSTEEDIDTVESILLGELEVDPLYSYVVTGGYTPGEMVDEAELNEIKFIIRDELSDLGKDFIGEIDEVLDNLEGLAMDLTKRNTYYLPITSELESSLNIEEGYKEIIEKHKDFLQAVGNFFESKQFTSKTTAPLAAERVPLAGTTTRTRDKPGLLGSDRKELEGKSEALETFVKLLKDYYVKPLNSKYYPFDVQHPLKSHVTLTMLSKYDSTVLDEWQKRKLIYGKVAISNSFIRKYRAFLDTLSSKMFDPMSNNFKSVLTNLVKELTRMFSKTNRELVVIDTLNVVAEVLKDHGMPIPELTLYGVTLDIADEKGEQLPYSPLQLVSDEFREDVGERGKDKFFGRDDKILTDVKAIRRLLQKEVFKIIKSDIPTKLLIAHDGIRKMNGLPVYYRFGDLENVEHMESTLDIIKSDGYDISALDVERIVVEVDSYSSIAKQYGVNTETVYKLKAMFR